jgi:two-component system chemotaxis response regulator CheB
MVSSLTQSGAESTLKALEYGALDFIPKNMSSDRETFAAELQKKVRAIARRKTIIKLKYRRINQIQVPVPRPQPSQPSRLCSNALPGPRDLVVIGVSTGGPPVVQKILSALPADLPACILIAQHMPAAFTNPFAKRLDSVCKIGVTEARMATSLKQATPTFALGASTLAYACAAPCQRFLWQKNPAMRFTSLLQTCFLKLRARPWQGAPWASSSPAWVRTDAKAPRCCAKKAAASLRKTRPRAWFTACPRQIVDNKLANLILDVDDIANAIITTVRG